MAPGLNLSHGVPHVPTILTDHIPFKEASVTVISAPPSPTTPSDNTVQDSTIVLHPSLITQEFDLLRFEAAAYDQLLKSSISTTSTPNDNLDEPASQHPIYSKHLISSPYNNPGHYLNLATLPLPSLLLAKALTALKPIVPDYATASYTSALNLSTVLDVLRTLSASQNFTYPQTSFYVVTFRSQLKPGIDNDWLYKLDYESHREACESGGLLKYWFGKANDERRNLATCFWHSREDAHKGGLGPWHKKARAAGRELYERIVFSTHRFTVLEGAVDYVFEDWKE